MTLHSRARGGSKKIYTRFTRFFKYLLGLMENYPPPPPLENFLDPPLAAVIDKFNLKLALGRARPVIACIVQLFIVSVVTQQVVNIEREREGDKERQNKRDR